MQKKTIHSDLDPKRREKEPWAFFCVTTRKGEFWEEWRKKTVQVIGRYRVLDQAFYTRLQKGHIWICEKHYAPEDIELSSSKYSYSSFVLHVSGQAKKFFIALRNPEN